MLKRILIMIFVSAVGLVLLSPMITPQPQIKSLPIPSKLTLLDSWLEARESKHAGLAPEHKKSVLWSQPTSSKFSIVYLHGFSASKVEISPVIETLAKEFQANAFFTRLTGHGLSADEFGQVEFSDYINDAEEAYHIGRLIGEKVIVIGSSTGGSLAAYIASKYPIEKLVLLSPNFGLNRFGSNYLAGPLGSLFAKLFVGRYREWPAKNEHQAKHWTTRYDSHALVAMMNLVNFVRYERLSYVQSPALVLLTKNDQVISLTMAEKYASQIPGAKTVWIKSPDHTLAGDIMSPETTGDVIRLIGNFIRCDKECSSK